MLFHFDLFEGIVGKIAILSRLAWSLWGRRLCLGFAIRIIGRIILGQPVSIHLGLARILSSLIPGQGANHHIDTTPDKFRGKILMTVRCDFRQELSNDLKTIFCMRHFPPAELQGDFHLHFFAEEIHRVLYFHTQVVRINLRTELNFLNACGVLMFSGFFVTLGLLIPELAVVNQATDRRSCVGCNLDEVNPVRPGHAQCLPQAQNSELLAIDTDDPNFAGTDLPVNPDVRTRRRRT